MRALWLIVVLTITATKGVACESALQRQSDVRRGSWKGTSQAGTSSAARRTLRQQALRQLQQNLGRFVTRNCSADCQADQRDALSSFYEAWGGPGWLQRDNWLSELPVCRWHGVLCCLIQLSDGTAGVQDLIPAYPESGGECPAEASAVLGLSLTSNNLTGDMGAVRWSAFSSTLLLLELDDNFLHGDTSSWGPSSGLAALTSLQYLSAGGNALHGPLGPLLRGLPDVWALMLHSNQLRGTLPEELVTHPSLAFVDLDDNRLVGPLPTATFTSANRLRSLSLAHNQLNGSFPEGAAQLPALLSRLDVAGNQLTGPLPRYLSLLLLDYLDASSNALSGPVAPLLQTAWALLSLNLSGNALGGSLPADLRCRRVEFLDLSHNDLTGSIPASFAMLRSMVTLLLNGNRGLNGQLPDELPALSQLSYFDIRDTSMQAAVPGAAGLPPLITLSNTTAIISQDPSSTTCPMPLLRGSVPVGVAPYYWQYQGCVCKPGFAANYTRRNTAAAASDTAANNTVSALSASAAAGGPIVGLACVAEALLPPLSGGHGARIPAWEVVVIVFGGLVVLALALLLVYRFVPSVVRYRTMLAKRMPPGFSHRAGGCVVTLVLTDVEGSTELWEWDTDLMAAAIDLHDHTLRSQMSKWFGYEVQTEGDAFLMAFHEPADAVGWCITTQLALLNADWDRELFRHHKACIETHESLQPSSPLAHSARISAGDGGPGGGGGAGGGGGGTATVTETGNLPAPPGGPVRRPSLPPGIILGNGPQPLGGGGLYSGASGLSSARGGLTPHRVSAGGNDDASAAAGGGLGGGGGVGGGGGAAAAAGGGGGPGGGGGVCSQDNSRQLKFLGDMKQPEPALGAGMANAAEFADWTRYTRLGVLYRGLRVRMGVATGVTDAITSHAITQRMEYSGEVYRRAQAVADLPHGGQVLLDANTFNAIHNNLNDLGIRAVQILTRDKRSSTNGAGGSRVAFSGVRLGSDRRRAPRSARHRQSLELAFGPEAAEPPGGHGAATTDGDEDGAAAAAAAVAAAAAGGSGIALSVATSGRTMSIGGGWLRGGGGGAAAATPAGSLLSTVLGSGLGMMTAFARGSSPLPRHGQGPGPGLEPSSRSDRNGSLLVAGRLDSPPKNQLSRQGPGSGARPPQPAGGIVAAAAAQPSSMALGPSSIGGASSGAGAGGRVLLTQGSGSDGLLPYAAPAASPRPRASSGTGMYGGTAGTAHLERVSQESSCKDAAGKNPDPDAENPDRVSEPQLLDVSTRSGAPVRPRMSPATAAAAAAAAGAAAAGGSGRAVSGGLVLSDAPVSTSDMESGQYGGSPRDVRGHLREVPAGPVSQATPATRATAALNTLAREAIQRRSSMAPAISVVNMGVYELNAGGSLEYVNITQVLVPGLEERARLGKPLDSARQLTPAYFNAPAASVAPLGSSLRSGARQRAAFPLVTLVFCSMERFTEMLAVNRDLSLDVMAAYNDCVRRSLLACNGYECQEQEGNYMIAFARPADAVEWCLMLQELMMEVAWSPSMLRLPAMQEELHPLTGTVLFRGPRIKAGVYQGVPTRVSPHSTTGRADYFGPLVNRAARYCHAAAQGGQVIVSRSLVEEILRELTHGELMPPEALPPEELPVQQVAVIDNNGVVPSRWCMPQDAGGGGGGFGGGGGCAGSTVGNASAHAGGGVASGRATTAMAIGNTSSGGDAEVGPSTIGSIVVLPEFPASGAYGGLGGAGAGGGFSRLRRVRYQSPSASPPPPRRSYGGGTGSGAGTGESDRGGAEGVIVGSASTRGATSGGLHHALTFGELNGMPAAAAASDPSVCSTASVTSGSLAAAAAAAAAALDAQGSDPAAAAAGFLTVEVPLSELAKYDVSPASVPRRMRPAVEHALAESRRRAASARRDHLQTQSRLAAAYSPPLIPSRPPSRRSILLLPPPPLAVMAAAGSGTLPYTASAGPIVYSSSLYGGGGGGRSARGTGAGMVPAPLPPSGSVVATAAGMPLQPQPLASAPLQPLPLPNTALQSALAQQQQQQQRYPKRGSEPAYLELTPQMQQQLHLQQQLQVLQQEQPQQQPQARVYGYRGSISDRARTADSLPVAAATAAPPMQPSEESSSPLIAQLPPPSPRPAPGPRASFDLHHHHPHHHHHQLALSLQARNTTTAMVASAPCRPGSNSNPYSNTHVNGSNGSKAVPLRTSHSHHQVPAAPGHLCPAAPPSSLSQLPLPQPSPPQQQPQQPHRGGRLTGGGFAHAGNIAAAVASTQRSLSRRAPPGLMQQLPPQQQQQQQQQGAGSAAAVQEPLWPQLDSQNQQQQVQQVLQAPQWRGEAGSTAAAGGGPGPLLQSATLPSVDEPMLSHEHSAAFNALWEMATDEGGGGVPSGSRFEGDTQSAAVPALAGFEQESLMVYAPHRSEGYGDGGGSGVPDRPRLPAALRAGPSGRGGGFTRHRGSFLLLDSTPGCLPTLSELCIRRRVGPYKWLWAHEVVVEDLGQYRFKGVAGNHSIVSVSTAGTSERKLGSRVKKSKGERVEAGKGVIYRIVLQPMDLAPQPTDAGHQQAAYASESGVSGSASATAPPQCLPLLPIASAPAMQRSTFSAYATCPAAAEAAFQMSPLLHPRATTSLGSAKGTAAAAAALAAAAASPPLPPPQRASAPVPIARSQPSVSGGVSGGISGGVSGGGGAVGVEGALELCGGNTSSAVQPS